MTERPRTQFGPLKTSGAQRNTALFSQVFVCVLSSVLVLTSCSDDEEETVSQAPDVFVPVAVPDTTPIAVDNDVEELQCCEINEDCPEDFFCVREPDQNSGTCLPPPPPGQCYSKFACKDDEICQGLFICECNAECPQPTAIGECVAGIEPVAQCCSESSECSKGQQCVGSEKSNGMCLQASTPGSCWTDDDCEETELCKNAVFCPCDAPCPTDQKRGSCIKINQSECLSDADCNEGSCMAAGICTGDCVPGDPTCCDANVCVPHTNECKADADCKGGTCDPGPVCGDWCLPDTSSPSCCFGNTCKKSTECAAPNPQGCVIAGCPDGQFCQPTDAKNCVPTQCSCDLDAVKWECSDDCSGGVCITTQCPGANPQGCTTDADCTKPGESCKPASTGQCVPPQCECDEALGLWKCSDQCNGGVCK